MQHSDKEAVCKFLSQITIFLKRANYCALEDGNLNLTTMMRPMNDRLNWRL